MSRQRKFFNSTGRMDVFAAIARELAELCGRLGIASLDEVRGSALDGKGSP